MFSAFNCLEYFFWFKSGLHCFTHAFRVTPLTWRNVRAGDLFGLYQPASGVPTGTRDGGLLYYHRNIGQIDLRCH